MVEINWISSMRMFTEHETFGSKSWDKLKERSSNGDLMKIACDERVGHIIGLLES